jgi:hypothetical protein
MVAGVDNLHLRSRLVKPIAPPKCRGKRDGSSGLNRNKIGHETSLATENLKFRISAQYRGGVNGARASRVFARRLG